MTNIVKKEVDLMSEATENKIKLDDSMTVDLIKQCQIVDAKSNGFIVRSLFLE